MSKLNLLIGSNGAGKTKYIYDLFKSESRLPDGSIDFENVCFAYHGMSAAQLEKYGKIFESLKKLFGKNGLF